MERLLDAAKCMLSQCRHKEKKGRQKTGFVLSYIVREYNMDALVPPGNVTIERLMRRIKCRDL